MLLLLMMLITKLLLLLLLLLLFTARRLQTAIPVEISNALFHQSTQDTVL